ncbi:hypothetical protein PINS_up005300 [Pythium insidiosum]|nr:hypothetical protein PINS_up005300 [Pythium insidiosum]
MRLRVEHFLWQLFQVEEDIRSHEATQKSLQDELAAFDEKEEGLTSAYREKKKEHAGALRESKKSRDRIHSLQQQIDAVEPERIQLREQAKHSKKKMEEALAMAKKMKKKVSSKEVEIEALKKDMEELNAAKLELEAKAAASSQEESLVMDGARLEEYHRIKEAVQIKTNMLRNDLDSILRQQNADQTKVKTLAQEKSENEKIIEMLTDDITVADERIRNVSAQSMPSSRH